MNGVYLSIGFLYRG